MHGCACTCTGILSEIWHIGFGGATTLGTSCDILFLLNSANTVWFFRNIIIGYPVVYTWIRGWGIPGAMAGGLLLTSEKAKIFRFLKLENFQKMLKSQWKIYNILKISRLVKLESFQKILKKRNVNLMIFGQF